MQVIIDKDVCIACAACVIAGPEIFDQDENGQAMLIIEQPEESLREQILESVEACPVKALSLTEPVAQPAD